MPDLDALQTRGWHTEANLRLWNGENYWQVKAKRGTGAQRHLAFAEYPDRATAEAMLLAACAVADGLPTEREREALQLAQKMSDEIVAYYGMGWTSDFLLQKLQPVMAALTPTKEAPGE